MGYENFSDALLKIHTGSDQMISSPWLLQHRSSSSQQMSDFSSSSSSSSGSTDEDNTDDTSGSENDSNEESDKNSPQSDHKSSRTWMLDGMMPGRSNANNSRPASSSGVNNHHRASDSDGSHGNAKGSSSSGESEDNRTEPSMSNSPQKSNKEDLRSLWESNPLIYGVRRSGRARKEPERLTVVQDSDDSEPARRKKTGKKANKHESTDYIGTLTESDSEEQSTSEFDSPPLYNSRNRKIKNKQRNRHSASKRPSSKLSQMRAMLEGKKRAGSSGVKSRRNKSNKGRRSDTTELSEDSSSDDDDGRPQRSSSRNQNTKISYKEESPDETDSDDVVEIAEKEEEPDNTDCIERIMDFRMGKVGATGSKTTSYAIELGSDPNEGYCPDSDREPQFFISWKGWSHLHNTWESENSLRAQKARGMKKLENYMRKKDELDAWLRIASPEDAEYCLCQQELSRDLVTTYSQVDRVIAKSRVKNRLGFWDYQIKWKGLPYMDCTWEDGELIGRRFPDEIEKFERRQENIKVPRRDSKIKQHHKFVPMKKESSWLQDLNGLELRDYQVDGINWLAHSWCRNNSVILADEMGLGKTIQSITFLSYLYHVHDVYGPFLIIVPLSTIAAWQKEFQFWASFMNVIVFVGDATSRSVIRDVEWVFPNKKLKFNVVLTTYEILLKEKIFLGSHTWAVIAVDEAHRLKNEDSLLYRSLIEFKSHHRMLITGTPLQNSLKELWSLLHFIMPERFDSWRSFEDSHSHERETGYASLHRILQPYLLRRVKKDVEKSLPAKVERILRVEMSSIQKQYYRWILTKNYRELCKGAKGRVSSFCNIVMELKKCCNHAFLTKPVEKEPANNEEKLQTLIKSSGKMILLDKLLVRLKEGGHRVLIFSQMVRMLDLLQEYLIINRLPFQRLDGSIKGEVRRQALEHFNAPGSEDFCFLLSTRAGGLGINLASADTVIIFDSDWNPQNDLQAQARAHRIGQKNQVNIYRLVCVGSVEEDIIERAKRKMVLDHLIIQRMDTSGRTVLSKNNAPSASAGNPFNKDELTAILKFGAEEIFKEPEGEEKEPECDIDEILRRAETAEDQAETAGDELLSAFKFATFTIDEDEDSTSVVKNEDEEESRDGLKDWDEIIPEVDRKFIEEEERKKQEAELYLPPRIRKSLKMSTGGSETDAGSEDSDDEGSDDEDADDNDAGTRRRGKSRRMQKDEIPGFTSTEVRKFVKSFRKFGNPLERLDSIARDAELTVQSEADFRRLGEQLDAKLREMFNAHNQRVLENMDNQEPVRQHPRRGPSFRIGGASVSVKTTMACIEELQPLVEVMPKSAEERKNFRLAIPVKPMRAWDCEWTSEDDSKLLMGIYEYGMGSWEQIQSDSLLGLTKKILRPNNEKPQAKQLQSRVEYLMKLLRKTKELGRTATAGSSASAAAVSAAASRVARKMRQGKKGDSVNTKASEEAIPSKRRTRKIKSKARIDMVDDSDVDANAASGQKHQTSEGKKSRKIHKKSKSNTKNSIHVAQDDSKENVVTNPSVGNEQLSSEGMKRKIKRKHKSDTKVCENQGENADKVTANVDKKKKDSKLEKKQPKEGPVHITAASDPVPIGVEDDFSGELDQETFKVCKERMRPVKKSLKLLDKPPPGAAKSEKAQTEHMKNCLLRIGDRVTECLREFHDLEAIKTWRRNLWIFVSKFTEFNAQRLHKLYRRASRKRDQDRRDKQKHGDHPAAGNKQNNSQTSSALAASHGSSIGKKRSYSPTKEIDKDADSQCTKAKRIYSMPESRQRDRPLQQHHSGDRVNDVYRDRLGERRPGQDSSGMHPRYHPQEYQRLGRGDRQFGGDDDPRYPLQGVPQRDDRGRDMAWHRHADGYRYNRGNGDYGRQEYEDSRRYNLSPRRHVFEPHHKQRDERDYHRRSPRTEHFRNYRDEADGRHDWPGGYGCYPGSERLGSPYHHRQRRSPPPMSRPPQYADSGQPYMKIRSPNKPMKSPEVRTDVKELSHRGDKT